MREYQNNRGIPCEKSETSTCTARGLVDLPTNTAIDDHIIQKWYNPCNEVAGARAGLPLWMVRRSQRISLEGPTPIEQMPVVPWGTSSGPPPIIGRHGHSWARQARDTHGIAIIMGWRAAALLYRPVLAPLLCYYLICLRFTYHYTHPHTTRCTVEHVAI